MSQPHPPRPEDPPAQPPGDQQEPRTQAIPVVAPGGGPGSAAEVRPEVQPPAGQPVPGPAFSTEASYEPGLASEPAGGFPQSVGPQTMPPQPLPPGQVWPQPGSAPPGGRLDFIPGFPAEGGAPDTAASTGSTGATAAPPASGPSAPPPPGSPRPTGQLPAAGPGGVPGTAPQPTAGSGGAAKRLGARLGGGARAGAPRGARLRGGRAADRRTLVGLGLGVVGLVLLELGLTRQFGSDSLWSVVPTWSAFATVAALVGLLPLVLRWVPAGLAAGTGWRVGLAGVVGLGVFWVLVALPLAASDRGFLLTAGPALAAAGLWLAPGRSGPGVAGPGDRNERGGHLGGTARGGAA
jgi:hypothetical protein